MNRVAEIIGLSLPILTARNAVLEIESCPSTAMHGMRCHDCDDDDNHMSSSPVSEYEDQMRTRGTKYTSISDMLVPVSEDDDDESISTVSSDLSSSSSGPTATTTNQNKNNVVTFAETIVTAVHYRQRTHRSEKRVLYYTEAEYRAFRHDYHAEKKRNLQHGQRRRVRFADLSTINVIEINRSCNVEDLYYSEQELERFLDSFIESLNEEDP